MPYLVAAIVVVGLLGLLNLMLTIAVARRLRSADQHGPRATAEPMAPVGTRVEDFTVPTVDGAEWSRDSLSGETLVGFFSPGCPACEELVPEFFEYASGFPGGPDQVIAVVEAMVEDAGRYVSLLSPVARVVADPPGRGVVVPAFAVRAFPGVVVVDATGTITASGGGIAALPVPVPAR